jgi:hypothetical protein
MDPVGLFNQQGVLAIDGLDWSADLDVLYQDVRPDHKPYDDVDFFKLYNMANAPDACQPEFVKLENDLRDLLKTLYQVDIQPDYQNRSTAWRPFNVGPEPLHYDSFDDSGVSHLCCFVNVDKKPRVWEVSYTWPELIELHGKQIRGNFDKHHDLRKTAVWLRHRSHAGNPPIGDETPKHVVEFDTGTVWICDPKMVAHGIYSGGAVFMFRYGGEVSGGKTQRDFI